MMVMFRRYVIAGFLFSLFASFLDWIFETGNTFGGNLLMFAVFSIVGLAIQETVKDGSLTADIEDRFFSKKD